MGFGMGHGTADLTATRDTALKLSSMTSPGAKLRAWRPRPVSNNRRELAAWLRIRRALGCPVVCSTRPATVVVGGRATGDRRDTRCSSVAFAVATRKSTDCAERDAETMSPSNWMDPTALPSLLETSRGRPEPVYRSCSTCETTPRGGRGGGRMREGPEVLVPRRGKLGTSKKGNGEIRCGEKWAPILKYRCKIWNKFPECGPRRSIDGGWRLLLPVGLWLVAAISFSFLVVAWMVAIFPGGCWAQRKYECQES